jgi:hypothetical protein
MPKIMSMQSFCGCGLKVQSKWKISKHMKQPLWIWMRLFSLVTNEPTIDHLSNTYPSSNTMSMQTEHFLLNKCSHSWVWFWFKLKLNRKSMDMNIILFVKLCNS